MSIYSINIFDGNSDHFAVVPKFKIGDKVTRLTMFLSHVEPPKVDEVTGMRFGIGNNNKEVQIWYTLKYGVGGYTEDELEKYEEPEYAWVECYYLVASYSIPSEVKGKMFFSIEDAEKFAQDSNFKRFMIRSEYIRTDKETLKIFKNVKVMKEKDLSR